MDFRSLLGTHVLHTLKSCHARHFGLTKRRTFIEELSASSTPDNGVNGSPRGGTHQQTTTMSGENNRSESAVRFVCGVHTQAQEKADDDLCQPAGSLNQVTAVTETLVVQDERVRKKSV